MFHRLLQFILGLYLVLSLVGCDRSKSCPTCPTPPPDPDVPLEIVDVKVNTPESTPIKPGTIVTVDVTLRCSQNSTWLAYHYTRDDGATATESQWSNSCQNGSIGFDIVFDPLGVSYKFVKGHRVTFRLAAVKDHTISDTSSGNIIFLADKIIGTWFIVDESSIVAGSVNDSNSNRGISGVKIEVVKGSNRGDSVTTNRDNGRYLLPHLQPGALTLEFSHPGYQSIQKNLTLTTDITHVTVALKPR